MGNRDGARDLICEYTTWYHLLGVLSYLQSLPEQPGRVFFVRGTFFGSAVEFPHDVAASLAGRVIFCSDIDGLREHLPGIKASGNRAVLVTPQKYPLRLSLELGRHAIRHDVVVTEEGIGSYGGEWQIMRALLREERARHGSHSVLGVCAVVFTRLAKLVYFLFRKRQYWLLFDRRTLAQRDEVVAAYRAMLPQLVTPETGSQDLPVPCTLFVSAPLCELGKMDADRFRRVLQAVERHAGERERLVIKPHPIEDREKYVGYRTIAPGTPLEALLQGLNPEDVQLVGFSSTALYTSYLFFGVRPLRVAFDDCFYEDMSQRQRRIMDACTQPLE